MSDDMQQIAEQYLAQVEIIQGELFKLIRHHAAQQGWSTAIHALVETTGTLAAHLVEEDSRALPLLRDRLEQLTLFVMTAGQEAQ